MTTHTKQSNRKKSIGLSDCFVRKYTLVLTIVSIISLITQKSWSQENVYYPNFFSVYQFHSNQFSPAYMPDEGKAEFSVGYKSLIGPFHEVSSYYFSAARVFRNENGFAHSARVSFSNDKDGPYISSPRALANYAVMIKINYQTFLYAGLAAGGAGMFYAAPSSTQSSIFAPDGSIGLSFRWKKLILGASSLQIFNSSTNNGPRPLIFHRYYNLFGSVSKEWYPGWKLSGVALFRILPSMYNQGWAGLSVEYKKQVMLGANLALAGTLSVYGGWTAFINDDRLTISVVYNTNVFNVLPTWQNNIELGLSYSLR
ncbi:MAG: type IX secretion system membrane protein PorP/SprF [Cytophagales bacterium]|nr:type IX secretion system membrane protein PorP/SprF [Cytophagales bacterium]